jgi:hypothetical protein
VLATVTSIIVWNVSRLDRGHRLLESLFNCLARLRVAVNAEGKAQSARDWVDPTK